MSVFVLVSKSVSVKVRVQVPGDGDAAAMNMNAASTIHSKLHLHHKAQITKHGPEDNTSNVTVHIHFCTLPRCPVTVHIHSASAACFLLFGYAA
jgi:hypothetical protein